jgi:hypothetical protein
MKTKHFFNAVMATIIAVIFSVLAGCASIGATEDPTAAELANQLAADLNAIEAEKATVSGDTVTLIGGVRIENAALTVPEGVTLNLTKETLQLGDNATFTVNGTVNVKAEGINIDSTAASPAAINGSGTISLKSKGRLLGIWEGRKLTLDGVTLVGMKDNDSSLVEIGEGGEFILKSGAITGNTRTSNEDKGAGGGVGVWQGKFTMEGGTISGNNAVRPGAGVGGGVSVGGENATFTMEGGTISGNSASGKEGAGGGGVMIEESVFTMTGGEISGNSATGKVWSNGGGVKLAQGAAFTMTGGAISGNTATCDNYSEGGGVMMEGGATFTMEGGRIQGSTASDSFAANTLVGSNPNGAALDVGNSTAKWGSGGTYTKGGLSQTGGGSIVDIVVVDDEAWGGTDDTLIAEPAQ